MEQETLLANELKKMINEDRIPLSIAEDIHEITESLLRGEKKVPDLKGTDEFVEEAVQEAFVRIHKNNH